MSSSKSHSRIDVSAVTVDMVTSYPEEFIQFVSTNKLKLPRITSGNGMALAAMVNNKYKFWTPDDCNSFCKKFSIKSRDPLQLFNKKSQNGFESCKDRGKNMICYPYTVSNKWGMRQGFKYDGTKEQMNIEINNIKNNIREDYLNSPNEQWQLGHKNPESTDSSSENLVLQPPIQAKYRDRYIFIDTLTRIPTPTELLKLMKQGKSPYNMSQLRELKVMLNKLNLD
jgi:hypothetical protein